MEAAVRLEYSCDICRKKLSRPQRLRSHLSTVHGIKGANKKRYKSYVYDEGKNIPQRTLSRIKLREKLNTNSHKETEQLDAVLSSSSIDKAVEQDSCESSEDNKTDEEDSYEWSNDESLETPMEHSQAGSSMATNPNEICPVTVALDTSIKDGLINPKLLFDDIHVSSDSDTGLTDYTCSDSDNDSDPFFSDDSDVFNDEDTQLFSEAKPEIDLQEDIYLTILSYMLKYHLNGQASRDLTEMVSLMSSENSNLRGISFNKIKMIVATSEIQMRDFCEKCFSLFPVDETIFQCNQQECSGLRYKGDVSQQDQKQRKSYFTSLPLGQQIQDILERDGVWKCLQDYKKTSRTVQGITDITTGILYQSLCNEGNFLSQEENLTLLFNTDGIPLYKSSGVSIWPVYLVINELPPKLRFSKKNMILWGMWQAKGKPVFHTFLQPFIEEMIKLKTEGLTFVANGQEIKLKAMLIAGTMDLQAKAYLTEMTQHNGEFGCLTCEHPGKVVPQGKGHDRVYIPMECVQRTPEGILQNAQDGAESIRPVKGIKGVSTLLGMEWFDMVNGIGPDYMHGVLLGVMKKLLQLLFSATSSKKTFSLASSIKAVDRRLKRMKPTDDIARLPRPLENNIHHLKASELQNFLLFYAIPCLTGYMDEKYLDHLSLFVEGIFILLGDNISDNQMVRSEAVLTAFYDQFGQLYGENNCTLNLHNACYHLPQYVKLLGPLWSWSCFPFENMNGSILDCVHGTGDVCFQILWVVQAQKRLAVDSGTIRDSNLKNFTGKMIATKRSVNVTKVASNCQIAGGLVSRVVCTEIKAKVENLLSEDAGRLLFAKRIVLNNAVFYSGDYGRLTKRICHYVLIQIDGEVKIAKIDHFLYHQKRNVCLAVIRRVLVDEATPLAHPLIHHLIRISAKQESVQEIVMANQLQEKLMYLDGNKTFTCVSRLPNLHGLCS